MLQQLKITPINSFYCNKNVYIMSIVVVDVTVFLLICQNFADLNKVFCKFHCLVSYSYV